MPFTQILCSVMAIATAALLVLSQFSFELRLPIALLVFGTVGASAFGFAVALRHEIRTTTPTRNSARLGRVLGLAGTAHALSGVLLAWLTVHAIASTGTSIAGSILVPVAFAAYLWYCKADADFRGEPTIRSRSPTRH